MNEHVICQIFFPESIFFCFYNYNHIVPQCYIVFLDFTFISKTLPLFQNNTSFTVDIISIKYIYPSFIIFLNSFEYRKYYANFSPSLITLQRMYSRAEEECDHSLLLSLYKRLQSQELQSEKVAPWEGAGSQVLSRYPSFL